MKQYWHAFIAGLIIMVVFLIFYQLPFATTSAGRLVGGVASTILRILVGYWVAQLAKKQGRQPLWYVVVAVLVPAIMLIVIGLMGDKRPEH